jgi:pimeloyl-ACP methyl ester carboxylesterase
MALAFQSTDGRSIEVFTAGPVRGPTVVFHQGAPARGLPPGVLCDALVGSGHRVVSVTRPGYGASTRRVGRSVADVAGDVTTVLDALGVDTFATVGWSGGGPHALATAALLRNRCLGAGVVCGVAPYGLAELDFIDGMNEGNIAEFTAAPKGEAALRQVTSMIGPHVRALTVEGVRASMDALPSSILDAVTDTYLDEVLGSITSALADGDDGWVDDDIAFVSPWGFEPGAITCPVHIWHGRLDVHAPVAHARYLASVIPRAQLHLSDVEHLALLAMEAQNIGDAIRSFNRSA